MTQEEDDAKLIADVNAMAKKVWGQSSDEFLDTPAGRALMDYRGSMPCEQRMKEAEVRLRYLEEIGRNKTSGMLCRRKKRQSTAKSTNSG